MAVRAFKYPLDMDPEWIDEYLFGTRYDITFILAKGVLGMFSLWFVKCAIASSYDNSRMLVA